MRNIRSSVFGAGLVAVAALLAACGDGSGGGGTKNGEAEERRTLTVGFVSFAENQIVAEMYAQVLEEAGYTVERQATDSREVLQPAIESGDVDIAPEYLGSLLLFLDAEAAASGDPGETRSLLEPLLEAKGQTLLESSQANDTNAFVVTPETAEEHGLAAVSDLAPVAGELTLGGPPECPERPFCIPGLEETYGIEFGDFKPLDVGGPLTVEALRSGEIDVALLFSTSSVIGEEGWVLLEDDKALQTAENITPVVRTEALDEEIARLLNGVSAALTTENITALNGQVEIANEDAADVAAGFIEEQGLAG